MPISRESFFLGHSLVSNKYPKGVTLDKIQEKHPIPNIDLTRLGFFETNAPDFNTFYPDVKPEDLKPNDADYVYPIFRALSKTRLNKYGPINFSKGNVLKDSVSKLIGQTLYTNHEQNVGNNVGVIVDAVWQNGFKQGEVEVPGGINVKLRIDGKSHPKLARDTMSDPPEVHSVSVSVEFEWEQSHPQMDLSDFYNKLGTFDASGNLVERVVAKILNYHELSFVSHGADTFAQKIGKDGKLVNPEYADRAQKYKLSMQEEDGSWTYNNAMDWKNYQTSLASFEAIPTNLNDTNKNSNQNSNKQVNVMNDTLLKFLREKFGLAKDASDTDVTVRALSELPSIFAMKSELETTQQSLIALKAKYPEGSVILSAEDKVKIAALEALTKTTREEALKLYNLTTDKPSDAITKMMSEASFELACTLRDQYKLQIEEKSPLSCTECGSTNVSRASAAEQPDPSINPATKNTDTTKNTTTEKEKPLAKPRSNADVHQLLAGQSGNITGGIHNEK